MHTAHTVTIIRFGHMSSDLLACGASDGSLTVFRVSETPSVLVQLKGHSKDITGLVICLLLWGYYWKDSWLSYSLIVVSLFLFRHSISTKATNSKSDI